MTSERYAFRMKLHPGQEAEYRRRHDEIWPELIDLLQQSGVSDYSIWLDEDTHILSARLPEPRRMTWQRCQIIRS